MKLFFENRNGYSVMMSQNNKNCRLTDWDFGNVAEATNVYKLPLQHGEVFENSRLTSRDLIFTAFTYGGNKAEIVRALNPITQIKLTINEKIYAYGKIINTPKFSKYRRGFFTFTFRMFEPFFCSGMQTRELNGNGKINNIGDVETPLKIILRAVNIVTNPMIQNVTTGEKIQFDYRLQAGAQIDIDTNILNKSIRIINGDTILDGFQYALFDSSLFLLPPGYSEFETNCIAEVQYKNKWLEVML